MTELGVGYLSIVPEMNRVKPMIANAFKQVESTGDSAGQSLGKRLASGMGGVLKKSAVGVGVAAGAALGAGLTKGIGRLNGIEQAEAKLRGLGHSAGAVSGIMSDALASVKGTSFGLEEAATVAASAVAAGVKPGQDLQRTLKLVGDAATIAGTDMSSMGAIFNKVAASNKMQMDVVAQLQDQGVPILQMVAAEMGVTAEEAARMASAGEVSFDVFRNAMERGLGGAALEAGDTVMGAFRNMGAAAGRLGATLAGPFYNQAAGAFTAVTGALDKMDAAAKPLMESFGAYLESTVVPALREFGAAAGEAFGRLEDSGVIEATAGAFKQLGSAAVAVVPPLVEIGSSVAEAAAALGVSSWQVFMAALQGVGAAAEAVAPVLQTIADVMGDHPALVTAAVGAWAGFKTIPGVLEKITSTMTPAIEAVGVMRDQVASYRRAHPEMTRTAIAAKVLTSEAGMLGAAFNRGSEGATRFHLAAGVAKAGAVGLKNAASGLLNLFGGPWGVGMAVAAGAVMAVVNAHQRADRAQREMAKAAHEAADAQRELHKAVAGTTGALSEDGLAAAAELAANELTRFVQTGKQLDGLFATYDGLIDKTGKTGVEILKAQQAADRAAAGYEQLEETCNELGVSMDDVGRIVAEGGPAYDELIAKLRASGDAGNTAADELERVRGVIEDTVEAGRRMSPAFVEASEAVEILADSGGKAEDKLDALRTMMQLLGLAPRDAEQAMMDAAAAAEEIAESAAAAVDASAGLGDQMFDVSGKLDPANANARALSDSLTELSDKMTNAIASGADAGAAFEQITPGLQALQEQFHLTDEQMASLIEQFGLVPEEVSALVKLEGADQSVQDLYAVRAALTDVPPGKAIEVDALTEEATAQLKDMGMTVETLPDGRVRVNAQTEEAKQKLDLFSTAAATLGSMDIRPAAHLEANGLFLTADAARLQLQMIDLSRPTPLANMNISMLSAEQQRALQQVGLLDGQTPTPDAYMEIGALTAEQQLALSQVFQLDQERPTPVADLNNDGISDGCADAHSWLQNLWNTWNNRALSVRMSVSRWLEDHFSTGGRVGGGRVPGYATGGRLPVTGPGTSTTDGILGVDRWGMPTARVDAGEWVINARSSKRWDRLLHAINTNDPRLEAITDVLPAYATGGTVGEKPLGTLAATAGDIATDAAEATTTPAPDTGIGTDPATTGSRDAIVRALAEAQSSHDAGAVYQWGGISRTAADCSGFVGRVAWAAQGQDPDTAGRMGTTSTMLAGQWPGFLRGTKGPFVVGVNSEHMAATVDGIPVESGGDVGGPSVGEGDGAWDPQFTEHWYLDWNAMSPPYSEAPTISSEDISYGADGTTTGTTTTTGVPGTTSTTSTTSGANPQRWSDWVGEQVGEGVKQLAKTTTSSYIADALGVFGISDEMPGYIQAGFQFKEAAKAREEQIRSEAETKAKTASTDTETSATSTDDSTTQTSTPTAPGWVAPASESGDGGAHVYDPSRGADQWRSTVIDALHRVGGDESNTDITIRQIDIESGGDPYARNDWDINAANGDPSVGLLQVIGATFAAHRDPSLPDDRTHPLANIVAALNYVDSRYGGPAQIWPTTAGYGHGGRVTRGKRGGRTLGDDVPAWLSDGEFVVTADAADGNEDVLGALNATGGDLKEAIYQQGPQLVRRLTYRGTHAGLTAGIGAASTGLTALGGAAGTVVPGLAPIAAAGSGLIDAVGDPVADFGAKVASEMAGQVADAGVRMARAGERTVREAAADFTADLPGRDKAMQAINAGRTAAAAAKQTVDEVGGAMRQEVHVHYQVMNMDEAIRRERARAAQHAQMLAGVA